MTLKKIVSGGQTGVDRAALDAALAAHFPCGGWVTWNRMAEDGVIADRYPLVPLPNGGYRQRTRLNVSDSDGTAILYNESLKGGTRLIRNLCALLKRPYILINAAETSDYSVMRLTPRLRSGPPFRRSTTLCVVVDRGGKSDFEVQ